MLTLRLFFVLVSLFFVFPESGHASALTFVSDLISSSAPSASSSHTITFTVTNTVPAGGSIIITPQSGYFNIPAGLDHSDVDFLIAQTPGNYIERDVGSNQTTSDDQVVVISGNSGSITINLNTATGISAGNQVKIIIGHEASHQFTGDSSIINYSDEGSYYISLRTESGAQTIDTARAMVAIINQVGVGAMIQNIPPTMSNGNPSGAFSHTVTAIELWLNTSEVATCKYSTTASLSFSSMGNTFSFTDDTLHRTVVSGLSASNSYDYYVKCIDDDTNETPDDLHISFSIRPEPLAGTIPGPVGGPEGSGGPPIPSSSPAPAVYSPPEESYPGERYPADRTDVVLEGLGPVGSTVYVLKDGVLLGNVSVGSDSKFSYSPSGLGRGTYTFGFYAIDSGGIKSETSNITFSALTNTANRISNIIVNPTLSVSSLKPDPGQPIGASGAAIFNSSIEVVLYSKDNLSVPVIKEIVKPNSSGRWSVGLSTDDLSAGSYRLRARAILSEYSFSSWTSFKSISLGVDESDADVSKGSDINGDNKVNLTDFSIMLFNWGPSGGGTSSDLNSDNTVNLTDFSILLFNWTG